MEEKLYNVILTGSVSDVEKREEAAIHLSSLLKIENEKAKNYLSSNHSRTIKKKVNEAVANGLKKELDRIGIICEIEPVSPETILKNPEPPPLNVADEKSRNHDDEDSVESGAAGNKRLQKFSIPGKEAKALLGKKRFYTTMAVDLIFLTTLFIPPLYLLSLLGIGCIAHNLFAIANEKQKYGYAIPFLWFIPTVLFPITTAFALHNGLWKNETGTDKGYYRMGMSILLLLLILFSYSAGMDGYLKSRFLVSVENQAVQYLNKTSKEAAVSFLIARSANALISVAQSVNLSAGALVSGNISPGEFLDPINDMVERFSMIMLISTVSLGIQRILMDIGNWIGFSRLFPVGLLILLASLWIRGNKSATLQSIGIKILIIAIVIRIGIPCAAFLGSRIDAYRLDSIYNESSRELNATYDELDISLEDIKSIKSKIETIRARTEETIGHFINLIVVFTIRTILIPIITLWGLMALLGDIIGGKRVFRFFDQRSDSSHSMNILPGKSQDIQPA